MSNSGWVYVMINPSTPELVKVGKTTRTPEERAEELSGATGVASPFVVIYKRHFRDVDNAERRAHAKLDKAGVRYSNNREFFLSSPSVIVDLVQSIPDGGQEYGYDVAVSNETRKLSDSEEDIDGFILTSPESTREGSSLYIHAEKLLPGSSGEELPDPKRALQLLKHAAELGVPDAYYRLGDVYQNGILSRKDNGAAIDSYKKGAEMGHFPCFHGIATVYIDYDMSSAEGTSVYSIEDADRAWDKFFTRWYEEPDKGFMAATPAHIAADYIALNLTMGRSPKMYPIMVKRKSEMVWYVDSVSEVCTDPSVIKIWESVRRWIDKVVRE